MGAPTSPRLILIRLSFSRANEGGTQGGIVWGVVGEPVRLNNRAITYRWKTRSYKKRQAWSAYDWVLSSPWEKTYILFQRNGNTIGAQKPKKVIKKTYVDQQSR